MKNSRFASYALILIASVAVLAGCSSGSGFNPSASTVQQTAVAPQMQLQRPAGTERHGTAQPNQEEPCTGNMNLYGPATWWNESTYPTTTWTEFTGYYVEANTNQGIIWYPCPPPQATSSTPCSPSPTCPGNTYGMHVQVDYSKIISQGGSSCSPPCFLAAEASMDEIGVFAVSKKKTISQVGALTATYGSMAYSPIGVAVGKDGTVYSSAVSVVGSGFGNSAVLVFAPGSSEPSSTLSDPGLGQAPGTIAVDRRDDVFLSYTVNRGSEIDAQIDEFPARRSKPVPFATISDASDGALAITNSGNVVVSTLPLGSGGGQVTVFSANGKRMQSFAVSGLPTAISLDSTNKHLWVTDSANGAISEYAFPAGGSPLVTGPFEATDGSIVYPADALPKDYQKK
ncbi:MAG TPA: hypothetical protein VGI19_17940 [Candidatus Cybelea sp.]|jgi:hypothetical protein